MFIWNSNLAVCVYLYPENLCPVEAYLILLCFALECFPVTTLFLQIEDLWQFCNKQIYLCHFSNSICCLCHILLILQYFRLLNYYNICYGDVWLVIFDVTRRVRSWLALLSSKVFFKLRYVHSFSNAQCYWTLTRLHNIYMNWEILKNSDSFIAIFALLSWLRTPPTKSEVFL